MRMGRGVKRERTGPQASPLASVVAPGHRLFCPARPAVSRLFRLSEALGAFGAGFGPPIFFFFPVSCRGPPFVMDAPPQEESCEPFKSP